ncbi:MAG: tetratricopeptide repeat protein [Candidatus Thorarchaeota archaeon]|nr:tetratricopeptide repeat protein [Candidatus Thorarchaeota archaeon]
MYEHFRPSERVFVDRAEQLSWMSEALRRSREKSVVLHLSGIGGIGKSSLLEHWHSTIEKSIILDCGRVTDFFDRLNAIAKGAVRVGISLSRFDVLWSIRQRFVQGVEPAKEEGRGWAMEVLAPLPFIGSLTGIGTAIKVISQKISPKIAGKYGSLGNWLQSRLGTDYLEELLEILWKEPRNAEFLYLDALLEDLNSRKHSELPVLMILDGFDEVNDDEPRWNYRGRKISEAELWLVFLSSLLNSVGVVASRKALPMNLDVGLSIETAELCELDNPSCLEFLVKRDLDDETLQKKIAEVSGGNPFILDTICDMFEMGGLSAKNVESFRADTLEEVRIKSWKKLFSQVKDLEPIIERAGLLPHFDKNLLEVVYPGLKPYQWEQLIRFSFVRNRGDETWELHNLAKDLVVTELGRQLGPLCDDVSNLLEKESHEENNSSMLGLAFSVKALHSEEDAILKVKDVISDLIGRESIKEALGILNSLTFRTPRGKAEHSGLSGWALYYECRYGESEACLGDAIAVLEDFGSSDLMKHGDSLARFLHVFGLLMQDTSRLAEAETLFARGLEIRRQLAAEDPERHSKHLSEQLTNFAYFQCNYLSQLEEAVKLAQEAVDLLSQYKKQEDLPFSLNVLGLVLSTMGNLSESSRTLQEAIERQRAVVANDPTNTRRKAVLAAMTRNLALQFYLQGNIPETLNLEREALEIRKELYAADPVVYAGRLAFELGSMGSMFYLARQVSKAEPYLVESLKMYEELEEREPGLWAIPLSQALFDLSYVLLYLERNSEANAITGRAIRKIKEFQRQFGKTPLTARILGIEPSRTLLQLCARTYRMDLAKSLMDEVSGIYDENESTSEFASHLEGQAFNNMGAFHLLMRRQLEARGKLEKASSILSRVRDCAGVVSENAFSMVLCNMAILQQRDGRLEEAHELYQQSLGILEEIGPKIPIRFRHTHAVALTNHSILLRNMNLLDDAESELSRAIEFEREFTEIEPYLHEPILALSLNSQGILFSTMDRFSEAEDSLNEAVQIRRRLAKRTPEMHQAGLATSLHNHGILMSRIAKSTQAEKAFREALEIWERLVATAPELFNPKRAMTLHHLRILLLEDETRQKETKSIRKCLSSMNFEFSDAAELWIEEEEPLFFS